MVAGEGGLALVASPALAVLDVEVVAAPVLAALDVEVLVLLSAATGGLAELPPQPASRTPHTSAAAASRRACGERVSRSTGMLSCIWSPSRPVALCPSVVADGWLREGFAPLSVDRAMSSPER